MAETQMPVSALTYREARRAKRALDEISVIRDRGLKFISGPNGPQQQYEGKLVLPRRAKMRVRAMLRVLTPIERELTEQERELADEAGDLNNPDEQKRLTDAVRDQLDRNVLDDGGVVQVLSATDLGDRALDHIPPPLLGEEGLGPLFDDDEDVEDGAGDPRSRDERRAED